MLVGSQAIGPDHRPGGGGRFAGHRRRSFDGFYTIVRHQPECAQDVSVLGLVIRVVISHLGVGCDPSSPAIFLFARYVSTCHFDLLETINATCCPHFDASSQADNPGGQLDVHRRTRIVPNIKPSPMGHANTSAPFLESEKSSSVTSQKFST